MPAILVGVAVLLLIGGGFAFFEFQTKQDEADKIVELAATSRSLENIRLHLTHIMQQWNS
jgi:hypothetical protein